MRRLQRWGETISIDLNGYFKSGRRRPGPRGEDGLEQERPRRNASVSVLLIGKKIPTQPAGKIIGFDHVHNHQRTAPDSRRRKLDTERRPRSAAATALPSDLTPSAVPIMNPEAEVRSLLEIGPRRQAVVCHYVSKRRRDIT